MKWKMEVHEIEAVLEKIWDLHDKLSNAIHSISRTHFLSSLKNNNKKKLLNDTVDDPTTCPGFVFVKDIKLPDDHSAIQEVKSLNSIRSALENLEDHFEFFHTVQIQQQAERDATIARLEKNRIVLAMRLAEHQGKQYKVIEEALDFVGDVRDASRFVSPEKLYASCLSPSGENFVRREERGYNVLVSSFNFVRKSLKLDHVGGMLGNAALFAVSLIALFHLHRLACKENPCKQEELVFYRNVNARKASRAERSYSDSNLDHLDVMLARG